MGARIEQRVQRSLLQAGQFHLQTPVAARHILFSLHIHTSPRGPPSIRYNGYQGPFLGVKQVGHGTGYSPPIWCQI